MILVCRQGVISITSLFNQNRREGSLPACVTSSTVLELGVSCLGGWSCSIHAVSRLASCLETNLFLVRLESSLNHQDDIPGFSFSASAGK